MEPKFEIIWNVLRLLEPFPDELSEQEALESSIAKWEFLAKWYEDPSHTEYVHCGGKDTCGLCQKFMPCHDCPVTGEFYEHVGCEDTPYMRYYDGNSREELLAAARAEVEFLKSLQPEPL